MRSNGADYHGDLTKTITHLIARRPEGTKYKFAKDWKVRLVSAEWLYDTIHRGMILDEKLYHPEMLPEERGKGAWVRRKATTSPRGKRLLENEAPEDGSRKIRRTLSTKFTSQNEVIWGDIVGGSGALSNKVDNQEQTALDLPKEEPESQQTLPERSNLGHGASKPIVPNGVKRSTFSQCRFYIHGFEKRKRETLCRHLLSHDADVCDSSDDLGPSSPVQRYMVVPHAFAVEELPAISEGISIVTDWWVERCLEAKECLEHSSRTFDLPLPHRSVERFEKLTVSTTGFTGFQLLHLSKVVTLMGAKYDEFFSEKSSVLICNTVQQTRIEKLQRAKEWRIPVVSIDWLLDSIASGTKQLYKPYILRSKIEKTAAAEGRAPSQVAMKKGVEYDGFDAPEDLPLSKTDSPKVDRPPTKPAPRDSTAFDDDDDDEPTELIGGFLVPKEATAAAAPTPAPPVDPATSPSPEPLAETSSNSPRKPPALGNTAMEISDAITSLLAKSKNPAHSGNSASDGGDTTAAQRVPRKPSRILGRAPSNASRASSVDSTVSGGQAGHWPAAKRKAAGRVDSLGSLAAEEGEEAESQPPMTQRLQYEDERGEMYKAQVIARMAGQKPERREKVRAETVGSLDNTPRERSLRAREKGPGLR